MSTPYWDAVKNIIDSSSSRFNVPGHQNGGNDLFHHGLTKYDIPQIVNTVDKGENNGLKQALTKASELYGASKTWFLTGGASQGNRMVGLMLGQLGGEDGVVVAQRNIHSSFLDGVILAGLNMVFIQPSIDYDSGVSHGITVESLDETCAKNAGRMKGIFVQSPSYFGAVSDIAGFKKVAEKYNVPLIVDSAWGSHFGFHEGFPESALKLGADVVISSTHKMGGSLTQSAMLFLKDGKWRTVLEPLIDRAFVLTQSTSTSSILLASLDVSREIMSHNYENFDAVLKEAEQFKTYIRQTGVLKIVQDSMLEFTDVTNVDPLKVAVNIQKLGVTGFEVHEGLLEKYGVFTEMATRTTVLFIFGLYPQGDMEHVVEKIMSFNKTSTVGTNKSFALSNEPVLSMREAFFAPNEIVSAADAEGRISADMLSAYPPGIPNVLPGERLTKEVIEFLKETKQMKGGFVRGSVDEGLNYFRVVK
jgi:arginine decarboxylase